MTGFLAELGTKLADRWMALLILPGALFVAAAATADALGQAHALDIALLRARISALAAAPGTHSPGVLLLAAGGTLAASALAGLTAAALGSVIAHVWTAVPPVGNPGASRLTTWLHRCHPACWLTALRSRFWYERDDQWSKAVAVAEPLRSRAALIDAGIMAQEVPAPGNGTASESGDDDAPDPADILTAAWAATRVADGALVRRNRISLQEPSHPTWIGDRFRATETRIVSAYDLDITIVWPRLWTVLPESLRTDLSAANDAYTASARLAGWALLYLTVGAWWWPSILIAAAAGVTAWIQGRAGAAVLADLIETAVDLHGRTLAAQLGMACDGPLDREIGYRITQHLRSSHGPSGRVR